MLLAPFRAVSALRIPISSQAHAKLLALDGEDFTAVIKTAEKKMRQAGQPIPLTADEAEIGLRQYYAMPIIFEDKKEMAVSSAVDPYWHAHVLDTKGYRHFCGRVYGHFMDHVPMDDDNVADVARVTQLYMETHGMLEAAFGEALSQKVFPKQVSKDIIICTYEYERPAAAH